MSMSYDLSYDIEISSFRATSVFCWTCIRHWFVHTIEYCSPAWSPHYQKDKQLLEKVQHRFTSLLIPDLKKLCYNDRLQRLGLWSLEERRNRADLLEVFKLKAGLSNISLETFFERSLDSRTIGHSWKILKNRSKLDIRKFFFSERVVNRWNSLSQNDVDQTSLNGFKRVLERRRKVEIGFFMDWSSAEPSGHICFFRTGVATPGKLPGKLSADAALQYTNLPSSADPSLTQIGLPVTLLNFNVSAYKYGW